MGLFKKDKITNTFDGIEFDYVSDKKKYTIKIIQSNEKFSIPYILIIPKHIDDESMLVVEVNNCETENKAKLMDDAIHTGKNLVSKIGKNNCPVLIPVIPSVANEGYYQQLSKECFDISSDNPLYRIDLQVLNIIEDAKDKLKEYASIKEKVFFNGYSSSGVFAQRFALLHPQIIDTLCVGGASGSIPMPTFELMYPLGISDFVNLTGESFDFGSYCQIKFRYYVGQLEDSRKSSNRYDEEGNFAPMHDMSYFIRSVPSEIGFKQRQLYGKNLLQRAINQEKILSLMGFDIEHIIFEGRSHNNLGGHGVNELGDIYINSTYMSSNSFGIKR